MIKLIKDMKLKYWILFAILLCFIVIQAYFDVTLPMYTGPMSILWTQKVEHLLTVQY